MWLNPQLNWHPFKSPGMISARLHGWNQLPFLLNATYPASVGGAMFTGWNLVLSHGLGQSFGGLANGWKIVFLWICTD
jgi:hypothetical protein